VQREVIGLLKNAPEGIKLIVDPETGLPPSLNEITAEMEGPTGTPYEKKYFQLKLVFSSDFPSSPPRGFFLTKIYHPNVDMSTGAICVNTLKKDWSPEVTMSHVFSVIRCLLIVPFPESSLNDEAGKLFMESYEEYARRAKLMANVHAKDVSNSEACAKSDSPMKMKENEGENVNCNKKVSSSASSSVSVTVLKQSNSAERNTSDGSTVATKKAKSVKTGKSADKKKKKSGLKRL